MRKFTYLSLIGIVSIIAHNNVVWAKPHTVPPRNRRPVPRSVSTAQASLKSFTPAQLAHLVLPSIVRLMVMDSKGQAFKMGSGFVVGPNLIATNIHVIRDAYSVTANFESGRSEVIHRCVNADTSRDLVLLYANTTGIRSLPLMTDGSPQVGDPVVAVGNPEGYSGSISTGIISQVRRNGDTKVYQTTAPISHESSGGALVDMQGCVLGVTAFSNIEGQNLNFAYPAYYLQCLIPRGLVVYVSWGEIANGNLILGKVAEIVPPRADPAPISPPQLIASQVDQAVAEQAVLSHIATLKTDISDTQAQIDACHAAIDTFHSHEDDLRQQQSTVQQSLLYEEKKRLTLISKAQSDDINARSEAADAAQLRNSAGGSSTSRALMNGILTGAAEERSQQYEARSQKELLQASSIRTQEDTDISQFRALKQRFDTIELYITDQDAKKVVLQGTLDTSINSYKSCLASRNICYELLYTLLPICLNSSSLSMNIYKRCNDLNSQVKQLRNLNGYEPT